MPELTNIQLNRAEEAILGLSHALDIPEKEVLELLYSGMALETKGKMSPKYNYFKEEMNATFDNY